MNDPEFKKKYQKYKMRVKVWEKDFRKKHGRIPSKYDIQEAPREIRDSYKMYYKLKTSFLEDTLSDVFTEDGFDVLEISQTEENSFGDFNDEDFMNNTEPKLSASITKLVDNIGNNTASFTNLQELPTPDAISNVVNVNENHVIKNFEAVEELESNKKAWGRNVSSTPNATATKSESQSFKPNLKMQLFNSSSFSKRNPRKSLNRSNLDTSLRSTQSNITTPSSHKHVDLPDLETILLKKAQEQQEATVVSSNQLLLSAKSKDTIRTHVDEGWLQRNSAQISTKSENINLKTDQKDLVLNTTKEKRHYGLSNINVSNIIQSNKSTNSLEILGLKKVDSQIGSTDVELGIKIVKETKTTVKSDSDSVVSDSGEETVSQEIRHIVKRRKIEPSQEQNIKVSENLTNNILTNKSVESTKKENNLTECDVPADDNKDAVYQAPKKSRTAATKRAKKVIKNAPKKSTLNTSTTNDESANEDISTDQQVVRKKRATTGTTYTRNTQNNSDTEANKNRLNTSTEYDFTDDDKDADYQAPKAKRKTIAAKRTKKPKKSTEPKNEKLRASKNKKEKTTIKKGRKSMKANPNELEARETKEQEEQPLNPDDLKYALALENSSITSVPRIKISELDAADNVAQNYINTFEHIASSSRAEQRPIVDEKREAARKKLEAKIASGKLNENFVTINIQKKTFVRGRKNVNYSKYKKKMWKHKKRISALTGPDMDMGGCDGGVLTCFTCGQTGHFAQNCKIKGDGLLPLSAQIEEDPSPFPTMEEVEHMASQKAISVHSRNISKLPASSNAAIYRNKSGDQEGDSAEDCSESDTNKMCEDGIETDEELEGLDLQDILANMSEKEDNIKEPISPIKKYVGHKIPEDFLEKAGLNNKNTESSNSVGALYDLNSDGTVKDVTPEVLEALHMFGHTSFRKGQDRAIMRILSGLSTLVTLSTGSGKSLCYQLPAYLYSRQKKSITLVISPLVSLMEDQVTGVPHFLRAHCLHTNQTPQQRLKILQMISNGEIDILLVSPEAVVAGERSTGFGSILRQLPPIAFACIDEVHCVSQWSHNFRPSYLMVCKVLKNNLGIKTVLGLTATATKTARMSIIDHLGIPDPEFGIISDIPLPDNLVLSASKDENKDNALLYLLNSKRFDQCQSIIIYCTRRDECERIAGFLRTVMQDRKDEPAKTSKRKRVNWQAEPYHAGMPASRRRTIQNAFMSNELRIVVATIAFGMGINKPDIRAVIHYNMPRNFESYVQEIGRAGRDGKISHCHLFLDSKGNDQNELRRHIYANSIDRHVIRKLLQRVFVPCACDKNNKRSTSLTNDQRICQGHEIGFSAEKTVETLDIPEENISTLLCYLELDTRWNINVLSSAYVMAKVISYGGAKYLKYAAKECPPLAMAIALKIKNKTFKEDENIINFSVVDIAAAIGWNSGVVKYQLKNLEWIQVNGRSTRSSISVSFYDLGFRIKAPGDFTSEETDDALDTLYNRAVQQEKTQLIQLQYVFHGLSSVSYNSYGPCASENFKHDRSDQLKAIIREYFRNDYPKDLKLETEPNSEPDDYIIGDINAIINMYPDNDFSGRNIARIFHGIASPNYPALIWGRCKYWRAHSNSNFNKIVQLANAVIVKRRT